MGAVAPLLSAIVAGGVAYVFGRLLKSREQFSQEKLQCFKDYIEVHSQWALWEEGKDASFSERGLSAKIRICVFGNARVVGRMADLQKIDQDISTAEHRSVFIGLIHEMRRDAGVTGRRAGDSDIETILFGLQHKTE